MPPDGPPSLADLAAAAATCTNCHLYQRATQTVFGAGAAHARILLVGEQPGDREDLEGRPFVGPAGGLLDAALAEAGIAPESVYITNVVKHFKWEPRGKRRIHKKPNQTEIRACMPWLQGELAAIGPRVIVCLGATAAQALMGRAFRITLDRGRAFASALAPAILATWHPSAVLRAPDAATRQQMRTDLIGDLRVVAGLLQPEPVVASPP
jgi:DNA polymerase